MFAVHLFYGILLLLLVVGLFIIGDLRKTHMRQHWRIDYQNERRQIDKVANWLWVGIAVIVGLWSLYSFGW